MDTLQLLFSRVTPSSKQYQAGMDREEIIAIVDTVSDYLEERGVEHETDSVWLEREWTDFPFDIHDLKQMDRINTLFQDEITQSLAKYSRLKFLLPTQWQVKNTNYV